MARAIGRIAAPIILKAVGLAGIQAFVEAIDDPAERKATVMNLRTAGIVNDDQATILIQHNHLEAA
ncbi:hypothetical protein WJT74_05065 [Sphingomicrobium sp. XHP0239]|uniref:hypothetical protein n=1 Tax=Sphingomicrobium maritimum TaxID=3133972 RepID=UPI0031CC8921